MKERVPKHVQYIALCVFAASVVETTHGQNGELHGQASGWLTANPGSSASSQVGLRYLPDLLAETDLGEGLGANMEFSVNSFGTARYGKDQVASYEGDLRLYRAWLRISTERFEARIGLQKINFGSATLFRPLMWFDRIDPRDPLQLTDGVYGLLARYYFMNNANIWLWGLYGNTETKGWELVPTEKRTVEYGGRVQLPLLSGEAGLTYHHRRADLSSLAFPHQVIPQYAPEDRWGLDGKWDIGIGAWMEAVLIRQEVDIPGMKYQRQWTLGADYTFGVGNGLYAATEYFEMENPQEPFGAAQGRGFSGLSLSYPIGILDQVSTIFYRDWRNQDWYRIITWQRKYDNWTFYLLGFWNPETIRLYQTQAGSNAFAGTGVQFIAVFNH